LTQKKDCLKNQKWKCKYKWHESLSWCTDSRLHKWRPQCLWVPNLEVQSLHRLQWYKKTCILKNHQWKCNCIWQYNFMILMWGFFGFKFRVRGYGITCHSQQYFNYIVVVSFIGGENRRKSPTCRTSLTNFITMSNKYTSPRLRFELSRSVVIGTDCIGIKFRPQGHWFQILCGQKFKVGSNGKFLNKISEEPGMETQLYFAWDN